MSFMIVVGYLMYYIVVGVDMRSSDGGVFDVFGSTRVLFFVFDVVDCV